MADTEQPDVAALTVQLLSAYLANNTVAHTDIADLVRTTKAALIEDTAPAPTEPEAPAHTPAVAVRKSLASPDHILSLIDGKPYKTLKRHLTSHGLTPASYRERYGLPASYPMVAPGFAAQRRAIAERIGLGRRTPIASTVPAGATLDASPAQPEVTPAPTKTPAKAAKTAPSAKAPAKKVSTRALPSKSAQSRTPAPQNAPIVEPTRTTEEASVVPADVKLDTSASPTNVKPAPAKKAVTKAKTASSPKAPAKKASTKTPQARSIDGSPAAAAKAAPAPTSEGEPRPRKARGTLNLFKSLNSKAQT